MSIKKITFRDLLIKHAEFDLEQYGTDEVLAKAAGSRGVKVEKEWGRGKILDEVYKELVRPRLDGPLFLIDHPIELSPLAKKKEAKPNYVERFQLIIAGREICNAFSELNDPMDQKHRFQEQEGLRAKGDEEAQAMDEDYLTALEHGLPPTAGWGMGVDRLTAITLKKLFFSRLSSQNQTRSKNHKMISIIIMTAESLVGKKRLSSYINMSETKIW